MGKPKLDFINLAYGGAIDLHDQLSNYPQDFAIANRPEYGAATPWLKPADHMRGVMYGNKRHFDLSNPMEDISDRIKEGTVIGILAIPQYSRLHGLEVRIERPLTNVDNDVVMGSTIEVKLASTGEVLANVPVDATGAFYYELADLVAEKYTAYGNDAIEFTFMGVPEETLSDDEILCVPLPCASGWSMCMSIAVNYINNAMEERCQRPCDTSGFM